MISIRDVACEKIKILTDLLESYPGNLNLDLQDQEEELLITDSQGQQFLLNYHGVTQQLWYSSALSGAHQFFLNQDGWICTRTGISLNDLLSRELCQITGRNLVLSDRDLKDA